MKKNLLEQIKSRRLYFDGGTGSVLQSMGLPAGTPPEQWNIDCPEKITALHRSYLDVGCRIIKTNTFGVQPGKHENWEQLLRCAIACAKEAVESYDDAYIALDLGPTGHLLRPLGDLDFEEAVSRYAAVVRLGASLGVDLILIETMNDAYETKAALLGAKENTDLPIFVTNAYSADGKLMTGADPEIMVTMLEGLGADGIGINCSLGPDAMIPLIEKMVQLTDLPILCNPNAGLPSIENGKTVYATSSEAFAESMVKIAQAGAAVLGGCCGTTPEYLRHTVSATKEIPLPCKETSAHTTRVCSGCHTVVIGENPILIGERINPTGKPKLKEALRNGDVDFLLREGAKQTDAGVHILDVNVGLPEIDEPAMMAEVVTRLQAITELPLQIDTGDPVALERAMRLYNGKPLINSVNGKAQSMASVFPLVKKYGGAVIALTIDENGIPNTPEARLAVAKKIAAEAEKYGIAKKELIVDPLAMAVSADRNSAEITLKSLCLLKDAGFYTSLGISNISFGLPSRETLNSVFFANALYAGLNCAIMNPFSQGMMHTYAAYRALHGLDSACGDYVRLMAENADQSHEMPSASANETLCSAVLHGLSSHAASLAAADQRPPLTVIETELVPALNQAGAAYEQQKIFLPQLLQCAEAAAAAFAEIKKRLPASDKNGKAVILATVKGDIHDIGKNIVRTLLESYGFSVIDLGRDIAPETVSEAVSRSGCRIVGLSALMTTTVPAMEQTVALLHRSFPDCRVVVGGAVLNAEYAASIGADFYAPEATDTVRYVQSFYH